MTRVNPFLFRHCGFMFVVLTFVFTLTYARDGPDGKGRVPLLGWNTWCTQNTCGVDWCTSSEVLDVAQTLKSSGMLSAGYDHVLLDDCWGVRNNDTGQIEGDPTRFPEGMPAFIEKIHNLGFKFGLYTDIGTRGCHFPFVGSWPDYQRDADTFASWEGTSICCDHVLHLDYVKFDGCFLPEGHDPKTLTCNMSHALNKTGRDMWLNFHCWHDEACATCGNSFRVSSDHHDVWSGGTTSTASIIEFLATQRQTFWGPDPDYGWPDPDFIFTGGQGCGNHSGPGIRCPGQTEIEYKSEYSIWAIAGGQIVLASDPRNMTQFMRDTLMNDEVIAVYRDVSGFRDISIDLIKSPVTTKVHPMQSCSVQLHHQTSQAPCTLHKSFDCVFTSDAGHHEQQMWTDEGCRGTFICDGVYTQCDEDGTGRHTCDCVDTRDAQVWMRPTENGSAAVVLHNPSDAPLTVTFNFSRIPARQWDNNTTLKIRDLWEKKELGEATGHFTTPTPIVSHGSMFLKLAHASTKVGSRAWLSSG